MLRQFSLNPGRTILFSLGLAMLSFPIMARVWFDYLNGGSDWRQGDWLINLGAGFVRRGIIGEAFIILSDFTGVSLLVLVQLFQSSLFIGLVFVIWAAGLKYHHRQLLLFLAASPAFFLIFWAGDLQGIMRKELFMLLALALLTMGSIRSGRSVFYPALAVVLYTLGTIGNAMHSLMVGSIIAGLYLALEGGQISRRLFAILAAAALAMAVFWMGLAVLFREVPELAGLCEPLIARGFDAEFCDGALSWMVTGEVDFLAQLTQRMTPAAWGRYLVVVALSLVPVVLSFFVFGERRLLAALLLISFVPMFPLYAVATDWGRWLSISYTSYAFLLIQAHAVGRLTIVSPPPMRFVYPLIVVALVISPAHGIGWMPGGAIRSVITSVMDFL